jgi:NADH:ubiquinone oxidoreductase subunit E
MTKISAGPPHPSRYSDLDPAGDPRLLARVSELIADLQPDNAGLLTAFHRIQHDFGYVPPDAIPALAARFGTTPAILYGTLDFYSEIRTGPPAEKTVEWCSGPACLLKGSTRIRAVLESLLGCEMGANSGDGRFGLRLVQCDGTCHLAPLVRLNGEYLGPLSVSDSVRLARELAGIPEPVPAADGAPEPAAEGQEGAD